MANEKRPYRKRRRAESEAQTRLRITESTVELHGTVGPARTSISAVAERAGVRRSTVYRHFPDESSLFRACTAHWMGLNPPPDLNAWAAIADPDERLKTALAELYGYYRGNQQMMENLYRDEDTMAIVKELFSDFRGYLAAARDTLITGRRTRGRARNRTAAATGHALAFHTWLSLTREQGLDDLHAADLMRRLVTAAEDNSASSDPAARSPFVR
ncbi:MAG: TetR/AcrR family transcriptional regulator [Solirubrobacteraceae bacterium]